MSTGPQEARLIPAGQGKSLKLFAVGFDYKLTSHDTAGVLAALEISIPPKTLVKPHSHSHEDEFTVVLSGTIGARVGDDIVEAAAGASMVKPRGLPHAMWNSDAEPARVLEILSPGGLEDYFEQLAPILRDHAPRADYDALAERYGLTIEDSWIEDLEARFGVKL